MEAHSQSPSTTRRPPMQSRRSSCGTASGGIQPFDTLQSSAVTFVGDFDASFDQIGVETFANSATITDDDRTNGRVWTGATERLCG